TPGAVTIIEVKNTAKNIFLDENGDYFRTGEYLRWDCNIAEKMTLKEGSCRTKNGVTAPFSCEKHKSQTTKSPAFAVKYIYATK
ncbi:MAG: hypothetical protein IJJ65_11405, partial [Butyrivibrio sp.]|nr:hypothetical protein [Butyrivibrio sp.]